MNVVKRDQALCAFRWFKNGDHPNDGDEVFETGPFIGQKLEGKAVRHFRHPSVAGEKQCETCGRLLGDHGWIDKGSAGWVGNPNNLIMAGTEVCPGDWIVSTPGKNDYIVVKHEEFMKQYAVVILDESESTKILETWA